MKPKFGRLRDFDKPKIMDGYRSTFQDAVTEADAIYSARRINQRVRRENAEKKQTGKDARLAALLPRWCPDEDAGK